MRSSVSGIQIPTTARLNIDGEFTLDAAAGTSGHMLVSQGAGNTPAWSNTLTSPTIDIINAASSSSTTAELFGNVTTGTVGIADGLTTGTLNIGNGTTTTTGRTVNINTNASGSITVTTNIGSSTLGGTINLVSGLGYINLVGEGTIKTQNKTGSNSTALTLKSGDITTSGTSGNVVVDVGSGVTSNGTISIGTTAASGLTIGRSGVTTTVNGTFVSADARLNNPLLTRIDSTNEGGQINLARASDNSAYWYIDSFGSTSTPSLRFVENLTPQLTIATGGVATFAGAVKLRSGSTAADSAPLYFGNSSPSVLTTPVQGAKEFDNVAFYATPNATTGRAVDIASYYYVSDGSYAVDHSVTATAKSIFGSAATGLTLIAGTTYEFELNVYVSVSVVGTSAPAWSHSFLLTTVSGSPTTTIYQEISTSSNTTSQATSSTVSRLRNTNNATVQVLAATTTGSRHAIYNSKGIIRVTGTGSVEISPAATASATSADYSFGALAGSYIKITPIGNGTVAGVGAWA